MTVKDCRGNESTTLFFVRVTWLVLLAKFITAGMSLPYIGLLPEMGVAEFGVAVTGVLFIWTRREHTEKNKPGIKHVE
ncbi:MAG TPA: hypothetical protein ENJ64_06645 [Thiotrichales bacterium]|nr:hypothetical protein [Thiotrichales bacterium]